MGNAGTVTDFAALDALYPLPPKELSRQWLLTRDAAQIPQGWRHETLSGWHLGAHPDADVCLLLAIDGTPIGWVIEALGYLSPVVDAIPSESLTLPVGSRAAAAEIEQALYGRDEYGRSSGDGLAGTWTAVVFGGSYDAPFQRVYLGATHSVVYCPAQGAVSTTQNLVEGLQRDESLSGAFDCLSTLAYFTFGLTAFEGLHRLLPNHYLDLETFQPVRHWPAGPLTPDGSGEEGAAAIVEYARRLLRLLANRHDQFVVFLSAGRDSRAVLSVLRPFADEGMDLRLSTSYGWNFESRVDAQAARRLARIAGLPHEVKRRRPHDSRRSDVLRAFARVGEAAAGPSLSAPGVTQGIPRDAPFKIGGMGGETGRALWWRGSQYSNPESGSDQSGHPIRPNNGDHPALRDMLIRRTRSPRSGVVIDAAEKWLSELPEHVRSSVPATLDLAYVEQRMGCWQAPMTYLFPGTRRVSSPMLEAFPIEIMLRLPKTYRAAGLLQRDMVAYGWPELLAVPFNKPAHVLQLVHILKRLPSVPRRIRRYFT